jgi:hypothetical protein
MVIRRLQSVVLIAALALTPLVASAINPVVWHVEISTTGQDVFWTSPTSLTIGLAEYDWSFEITELTATVPIFGDQDVLDLLDDTSDSGTTTNLPAVLFDELFNVPTTGSSAHIRIEVDAAGVGRASGTDIVLGRFLGLPIWRRRSPLLVCRPAIPIVMETSTTLTTTCGSGILARPRIWPPTAIRIA